MAGHGISERVDVSAGISNFPNRKDLLRQVRCFIGVHRCCFQSDNLNQLWANKGNKQIFVEFGTLSYVRVSPKMSQACRAVSPSMWLPKQTIFEPRTYNLLNSKYL